MNSMPFSQRRAMAAQSFRRIEPRLRRDGGRQADSFPAAHGRENLGVPTLTLTPANPPDPRTVRAPQSPADWQRRLGLVAETHHGRLYNRVRRLIGNQGTGADATDLTLEIMSEYQLWEYKSGGETGGIPADPWPPLAWRAEKRFLDWRTRRTATVPIVDDEFPDLAAGESLQENRDVLLRETIEAVRPNDPHGNCADVLVARFVEDRTLFEVGEMFRPADAGKNYDPVSRAKRLIERARECFRRFLEERGIQP